MSNEDELKFKLTVVFDALDEATTLIRSVEVAEYTRESERKLAYKWRVKWKAATNELKAPLGPQPESDKK